MQPELPINRTNLELKQSIQEPEEEGVETINRTNLELKHSLGAASTANEESINRTNLELKLIKSLDI